SRNQDFNGNLTILLNTGGGLVEAVERTVDVIRHHYEIVDFIIPDQAMSAGTVFALSGNSIYMDYFSRLGPIDPQFFMDGEWVPALGYLEKFQELNTKSVDGSLTPLEYALADKIDLADLHRFEQARELSIELLEKWLVAYKFKNWNKTQTTQTNVSEQMKRDRANQIAMALNDTKRWHAHSRGISMKLLIDELQLKIEDISNSENLQHKLQEAHSFVIDYMQNNDYYACFKSAKYTKEVG
ncbi:MAG: hypothetical protein OXC62_05340, partial [Aestuariivita sp.]|nr:hypothetical protein [Aestuariivita sp.]